MSEELTEKIARIVDPHCWGTTLLLGHKEAQEIIFRRTHALTKAKDIQATIRDHASDGAVSDTPDSPTKPGASQNNVSLGSDHKAMGN